MDPRISLVSLFVDDLEAAQAFYLDAFGWEPADAAPGIAFYQLGGVVLGLMTPAVWAKERTGFPPQRGYHSVNMGSREEVDGAFAHATGGGARAVVEPTEAHWGGYTCYVEDPWGNLWEIAHNPFWTVTADGRTLVSGEPA